MEEFPIWLKGAVWLVVCGTAFYVLAQAVVGLVS